MTIQKNFPGRKQQRRISALGRLKKEFEGRPGSVSLRHEIERLEELIARGGKKYTKKVGTNTGIR